MVFSPVTHLYVCHNIESCPDALSHKLKANPVFRPKQCSTCGAPLYHARTNFNLVPSLGLLFLFSGMIYLAWQVLFPPLISGVSFSSAVTKISEQNGVVSIEIVLNKARTKSVDMSYRTLSGTALANKDFASREGTITFEAGEVSKSLNIPILPDRDASELDETFYIELQNVRGFPSHTVIIIEEGFNKDLLEKSNVIISSLSGLSADLANDIATIKMLEGYLRTTVSPAVELEERYNEAKVSVLNAREKYLILFNDSLALDPTVVMASIDNRLAVLEREGFDHQHKTTSLMKQQLMQYQVDRIPLTDRWLQELGDIVKISEGSDSRGSLKNI